MVIEEPFWPFRQGYADTDSVMMDVEPVVTDFAATGRTGRRNALPDILGSASGAGTSNLPEKLAELSVSGKPRRCRWTHGSGVPWVGCQSIAEHIQYGNDQNYAS